MKPRVLITRAADQAGEFAKILENLGFEPLVFPLIQFETPNDKSLIHKTLHQLDSYDWLLLTSANAVRFFNDCLKEVGINTTRLKTLSICTVGPKTGEAAQKAGLKIDLVPENYQAEGVLESFQRLGVKGKKILFPRAEEGRELLPQGLKNLGAQVTLLPVYRTVKPAGKEGDLTKLLSKGVDVITFTSGSTVRNFLEVLGTENLPMLSHVKIACISEVTAKVAREHGINTDFIPSENTALALAETIRRHFG